MLSFRCRSHRNIHRYLLIVFLSIGCGFNVCFDLFAAFAVISVRGRNAWIVMEFKWYSWLDWRFVFFNYPQNTSAGACYESSPSRHRQDWKWKQRCPEKTRSERATGDDKHCSADTWLRSCCLDATQWLALGRKVFEFDCWSHRNDIKFDRALSVFRQEKTCQAIIALNVNIPTIDSSWYRALIHGLRRYLIISCPQSQRESNICKNFICK